MKTMNAPNFSAIDAKLKLNKEQAEAVRHFEGPMLVLAGPGSGKTTVIAHRAAHLIERCGVNPAEMLVVTFTRAAAREMQERFLRLCSANGVSFGTFHSVFFRMLRRALGYTSENVLSDCERNDMLQKAAARSHVAEVEGGTDFLQILAAEISFVKNELVPLESYYSPNMSADVFRELFHCYEEEKQNAAKLDFDDMLIKCHALLSEKAALDYWQKKYKFILIDEFQDINAVQYDCVRKLVAPGNNVFAVGDDDQSVYRFRGATPELLLRFPQDFPNTKTVTLAVNYRSTDKIIKAAARVISENARRYPKDIAGTGREGGKLSVVTTEDIAAEAANIAKRLGLLSEPERNDAAVLYRTNIQGRALADALSDLNIPFQMRDSLPVIFDHWLFKDIRAYLRLALDPSLDAEFIRIVNRPSRYISKLMLNTARSAGGGLFEALLRSRDVHEWQKEHLNSLKFYLAAVKKRKTYDAVRYIREAVEYDQYVKSYAEYRKIKPDGLFEILNELTEAAKNYPEFEDYFTYAAEARGAVSEREQFSRNGAAGVTLSTMHSAKGMEYETVYIAGAVEGVIPHDKSRAEQDLEEERRLFYVAVTRAKTNLIFSVTKTRYDLDVKPTRFLDKLR